jgi:hypothetical protein
MSRWGHKQYPTWARKWGWTIKAIVVAAFVFIGGLWLQWHYSWTSLQRYYLPAYIRTWAYPLKPSKDYTAVFVGNKKRWDFALDSEIKLGEKQADGKRKSALLNAARSTGWTMWMEDSADFNDRVTTGTALHAFLRHYIYQDRSRWSLIKCPAYGAFGVLGMCLCLTIPMDFKRHREYKHGRRLKGTELVRTVQFNRRMTRRKWFKRYPPDGLAFINEEQTWIERTFRSASSRWLRIPRDREAMHLLITGSTGHGKSATIRQVLIQIEQRGETAIVYDPKLEYLPQFYDPSRGDVILNPLDARCPFWTPGDEVPHPAEASTVAASLFPEQDPKQRFFVDAARKVFTHLLNLKPTPEELTCWMAHEEEVDSRIKGTELASIVGAHGSQQRSGVLGSLNMVADAFKMLPCESETKRRWSAAEWAKARQGWIFITSKPTMREQLRPLISLWIDLLVLRVMNADAAVAQKAWFVFDELASLQRLPQLATAITESRSANCPMVLGFQGKAQMEVLYGHIAEAMLSQPKTKIFLTTTEPNASEWISKGIGEVQIERYRETRTHSHFPQSHSTSSLQCEITQERLVMASEIDGLDPLQGYLKHGNYVVRLRVPYLKIEERHERFIERKIVRPDNLARNDGGDVSPPFELDRPAGQWELKPPTQAQQQPFFE